MANYYMWALAGIAVGGLITSETIDVVKYHRLKKKIKNLNGPLQQTKEITNRIDSNLDRIEKGLINYTQ